MYTVYIIIDILLFNFFLKLSLNIEILISHITANTISLQQTSKQNTHKYTCTTLIYILKAPRKMKIIQVSLIYSCRLFRETEKQRELSFYIA